MKFLRDRHRKFFSEAEWLVRELNVVMRPCQAEALYMALYELLCNCYTYIQFSNDAAPIMNQLVDINRRMFSDSSVWSPHVHARVA